MVVALYGRALPDGQKVGLEACVEAFHRSGVEVILYDKLADSLNRLGGSWTGAVFGDQSPALGHSGFFVTLGGDGTLLDSVVHVRDQGIPVLGINFGRLGYLTSALPEQMNGVVERLMAGQFSVEQRRMLHMASNESLFGSCPFALNELAIHKNNLSSVIRIQVLVDDVYMNTYHADGLVISTPTGSTGYNLSCGGPITMPNAQVFLVSAVAPHNLNVRPIVLTDSSVIQLNIESTGSGVMLSMDSRSVFTQNPGCLMVRRNSFDFPLVRLNGQDHLSTLRSKLMWGVDRRNEREQF
ncbi:MAG: NAD(+) kinase [Bacteroidetes bacterium]|jgi:NAD+ kinase|nr:NAD(+) kinase [Bacteroidota bacterium]